MKKLTIIMPFLNEGEEPAHTIRSINATCDQNQIDIIAIDDCSDRNFTDLSEFQDVKLVTNKQRIGVAACRQLAAEMASTPHLLIIDGHMRFNNDNWLKVINDHLEDEPQTLFCTTCVKLTPDQMSLDKSTVKYYGAEIKLIDETQSNSTTAKQIIEPKWLPEKEEDVYEIPCVLGANYAVTRDWFLKIKGLQGLQKWGGDEAYLSLKTWMAGGKCKLIKKIEIGHMFRTASPYTTQMHHLHYNKIFICMTILPENIASKLLARLPYSHFNFKARDEINKNRIEIEKLKNYYNQLFIKSFESICQDSQIKAPSC